MGKQQTINMKRILYLIIMLLPTMLWAQTIPVSTFPYSCDFEDTSENAQWMMANGSGVNKWIIGTATQNGGSHSLFISDNDSSYHYTVSSTTNVFAYRALTLPAGKFLYDFDWKAYGESCCDFMRVALVPDSLEPIGGQNNGWASSGLPTGAIALDGGGKLNISSSWNHRSGQIEITDAGEYLLVFYWKNDNSVGNQYPAAVDNILLSRYTCPTPAPPTVNQITTNSATLHWNTTAEVEIEYGPRGFVPGEGTTVFVTSADSLVINGLGHSRSYEVRLRTICGEGDTSMWSIGTFFITSCSVINQLPFEENFDTWGTGMNVKPACWTMGGDNNIPYIVDNEGSGVLNMYDYNSSSTDSVAYATLPELDNSIAIDQTQLVLRVKGSNSNQYSSDLIVGVCDSLGKISTFIGVDTLVDIGPTFTNIEIPLDMFQGTGRWITLLSKQLTHGYQYYTNQVYIDAVTLEPLSDCRRPRNLSASNSTSTSAVLNWTEMGNAQSWELIYGIAGYVEGTRLIVNSIPYTLTGLTAGTSYEYEVRSICSNTDTSAKSVVRGAFTTTQIPGSIPYNYGFEEDNEWSLWQQNSDNSACWTRGCATSFEGSRGAYISTDGGMSAGNGNFNSRVNASLYRDIDFGELDSSFTLSFMARAGGTPGYIYDGLMVLVEDACHAVLTPTMDTTSPWGSFSHLHPIILVRCDTTWQNYRASIDNASGVKRLVFYWFNMNTGFFYDHFEFPAAIDNIEIDYSYCPRPIHLTAETVNSRSVNISWEGPTTGNYEILYKKYSESEYHTVYASSNSTLLTGLDGGTQYECMVRKLCGLENSTFSEVLSFTTSCCDTAREYPYIENFEGGFICWKQQYLIGNIDWTLHNGDAGTAHPIPAYEGNSNVLLFNPNTTDQSTLLVSPVFDFSHRENAKLAFSHIHRTRNQRVDSLVVLYRTAEENEWEVLACFSEQLTDWTRDTLDLPMISHNYQIAFEGHTRFGYGLAIDKIIVTADTMIQPLDCYSPSQLHTVQYDQGNSVVLDWDCDTSQHLWEVVQYSADDDDSETYYITDTHPVTISQLRLGRHRYSFSVRALCDTNIYSEWSNQVQITTGPNIGIDQTNECQPLFNLYPNPSTGNVTIQLKNNSQGFHLQIMDMAGRVLKTAWLPTGTSQSHLLLNRGCYLIKVWSTDGANVQRIIVL